MTLGSILVPLDGSQSGEHALPHALSLARRAGARLDLVHVHEPVTMQGLPLRCWEMEEKQAQERARDYLDNLVERMSRVATMEVTPHLLFGRPANMLCENVALSKTDLVVMTTHGRGPLSRLWFGSVASELIQRLTGPLLLIRPIEAAVDLTVDPVPRRILIPLDGSPFAEDMIPLAVEVSKLTGAALRLLRVTPPVLIGGWDSPKPPPAGVRPVSEVLEAEARSYLGTLAAEWPELGKAETHVVAAWPPAGAILDDATANKIDLIAMETRGRSGLAQLLLGSVADKVVRATTLPVLLRHPPAE